MPKMIRLGLSKEDTALLSSNLEKLNELLIKKEDLILDTKFRKEITEYIEDFLYVMNIKKKKLTDGYLYRIRIIGEDETRFENLSDLLIPPKDKSKQGRMNNDNLRVLYVSFDQHVAELECGVNKLEIGRKYQVTRFQISEPIECYYLGMFSEIIFNLPYNSKKQIEAMEELGFKNFEVDHHYLKKIALAEGYLADALYTKKDKENKENKENKEDKEDNNNKTNDLNFKNNNKNYYILSSFISEIIFNFFEDKIDAILYPSQRNNYGMNIAIKEAALKKITPIITFENKVVENHSEKLVKYHTLSSADLSWSTEKIEFEETPNSCHW